MRLVAIPLFVFGCSGPAFEASPLPPPASAGVSGVAATRQFPVTGGAISTGGASGVGAPGGSSSEEVQWQTGGSGIVVHQSSAGSPGGTPLVGGSSSISSGGDGSTGGASGAATGSSTGGDNSTGGTSANCTGAVVTNGCFASAPTADPGWSCKVSAVCSPLQFCILHDC